MLKAYQRVESPISPPCDLAVSAALNSMLCFSPDARPSAAELLTHKLCSKDNGDSSLTVADLAPYMEQEGGIFIVFFLCFFLSLSFLFSFSLIFSYLPTFTQLQRSFFSFALPVLLFPCRTQPQLRRLRLPQHRPPPRPRLRDLSASSHRPLLLPLHPVLLDSSSSSLPLSLHLLSLPLLLAPWTSACST